jgi:hypothetical protein
MGLEYVPKALFFRWRQIFWVMGDNRKDSRGCWGHQAGAEGWYNGRQGTTIGHLGVRFMFLGFKGKQGVLDDGGKDFKGWQGMLGCKGKDKLRQWGMVEAPRETAIGRTPWKTKGTSSRVKSKLQTSAQRKIIKLKKLKIKQGVQKILLVWTQGKMCLMFQKASLI